MGTATQLTMLRWPMIFLLGATGMAALPSRSCGRGGNRQMYLQKNACVKSKPNPRRRLQTYKMDSPQLQTSKHNDSKTTRESEIVERLGMQKHVVANRTPIASITFNIDLAPATDTAPPAALARADVARSSEPRATQSGPKKVPCFIVTAFW